MEFMKFDKMLKDGALADTTRGKELDPEVLKALKDLSTEDDDNHNLLFKSLYFSAQRAFPKMSARNFYESNLRSIPGITYQDTQRYIDMFMTKGYTGSMILYYVSAALWVKTMHDLDVPCNMDHIEFKRGKDSFSIKLNEKLLEAKPKLEDDYYAYYMSIVMVSYFMGAKADAADSIEKVCAPAVNRLRPEDVEFVDKYIMITLGWLTTHLADLAICDNEYINKWIRKFNLGPDEDIDRILETAELYFDQRA